MNRKNNTYKLVVAALLTAIGIIIPLFSPIKINLEPMSFTLASHVPIFIAMFISPTTTIVVALGTTLGFFLGGFPIVVVLRALSHVIFATVGGLILLKKPNILKSIVSATTLSLGLGIIHGICEVLVVIPFYFGIGVDAIYNEQEFFKFIVLLVGVGTLVHSMVDFAISHAIWTPISRYLKSSNRVIDKV